jgi:hypothetical protein
MDIKISQFPTLSTAPYGGFTPIVQDNKNYLVQNSNMYSFIDYVEIDGSTYTLSLSDTGYIIKKIHTEDHILYVPSNVFPDKVLIFIRNSGVGNLRIIPSNLSVSLNYNTTLSGNIISSQTSTQIYHLGNNTWDIL